MNRALLLGLLLFSAPAGHTALAQQNSDFGFLVGFTPSASQVVASGQKLTTRIGATIQTNFAHSFYSCAAGDLWFEMPFGTAYVGKTRIDDGVSSSVDSLFAFTPGLRLKLPTRSWLELFAVAGAGFGSFGVNDVRVNASGVSILTSHTLHGIFDAGAIVDFRVSRPFSLRMDLRDYVTGRGLAGSDGRHHPIFAFGIAWHH